MSSAFSHLLQEQSLPGKEILSNTNSKSQQCPPDCAAAASDTWLCWKFCHSNVPQKVALFSSPQGTSGCFTPRTCPVWILEVTAWCGPTVNFISPHCVILRKLLLYGTANFPAEHSSRVDNKPLDKECCWFQSWTTVAAVVCQPQTVQIPLFISSSSNAFFLYYDLCTKKQFKSLCTDMPLTQALFKN